MISSMYQLSLNKKQLLELRVTSTDSQTARLPNLDIKRYKKSGPRLDIGMYDKLWQAVNSGQNKTATVKKKIGAKQTEGDFLNFGKSDKKFPGLNAPLESWQKWEDSDESAAEEKKPLPIDRGWTGNKWPGKSAGPPEAPNGDQIDGFESMVLDITRTSQGRKSGKHRQIRAIVAVGNKNGLVGWSVGEATFQMSAIRKARNRAAKYLYHVPICEGHTIYHDIRHKIKRTEINFQRKLPGDGIRAQRIVKGIAELAGIKDMRCKITGYTTPITVIETTIQGLLLQETHQDLADRTGKFVVEMRGERGNLPVVVASPSQKSFEDRKRQKKEQESEIHVDLEAAFDPYLGAHRPKSLNDIRGALSMREDFHEKE